MSAIKHIQKTSLTTLASKKPLTKKATPKKTKEARLTGGQV